MKYVHYPQIKDANPIVGFVDLSGGRYDLAVGQTIKVLEPVADKFKQTYDFLLVFNEEDVTNIADVIAKEKEIRSKKHRKKTDDEGRVEKGEDNWTVDPDAVKKSLGAVKDVPEVLMPVETSSDEKSGDELYDRMSWQELLQEAKEAGFYENGMKKPEVIRRLKAEYSS